MLVKMRKTPYVFKSSTFCKCSSGKSQVFKIIQIPWMGFREIGEFQVPLNWNISPLDSDIDSHGEVICSNYFYNIELISKCFLYSYIIIGRGCSRSQNECIFLIDRYTFVHISSYITTCTICWHSFSLWGDCIQII